MDIYGKFRTRAYKEFTETERKEFFEFLKKDYDQIILNNMLIEKKFNEIKAVS